MQFSIVSTLTATISERTYRSGGTTAEGEDKAIEHADEELATLLKSLGPREHRDIHVKTFGVETDGYFFGLVYERKNCDDPANPDATYDAVMLEPNDIIFHPPWDSGEYST